MKLYGYLSFQEMLLEEPSNFQEKTDIRMWQVAWNERRTLSRVTYKGIAKIVK